MPHPHAALAARIARRIRAQLEDAGCERCGTLSFRDCKTLGEELATLALSDAPIVLDDADLEAVTDIADPGDWDEVGDEEDADDQADQADQADQDGDGDEGARA